MISRVLKEEAYEYYILRNLYTQRIILSSKDEKVIDSKIEEIEHIYNNTPKEVFSLACSEQVIQGNQYNPISFIVNRYTGKANGGFDWDRSILGYDFWYKVLDKYQYHYAVELYNKAKELYILSK